MDNIEEIWSRLKKSYGDPKTMLQKRLGEVKRIGPIWKIKDTERLKEGLIAIINAMSDLMKLAQKHNIENVLYYGEAINIIYSILGDVRLTKWLTKISEEEFDEKETWIKLIEYLEKELKVQQEKSLINRSCTGMFQKETSSIYEKKSGLKITDQTYVTGQSNNGVLDDDMCYICGDSDHIKTNGPYGRKLVQYFACQKFVEMTPNQRFIELRNKGLCFQCLFPGAFQSQGKHKEGNCQSDFTCKNHSHETFSTKKHVLVCQEHCESNDNKALLEDYKERFILKQKVAEFSKNIKLSFHVVSPSPSLNRANFNNQDNKDNCIVDSAIYVFQTIDIAGEDFTLFFDSGCSDLVSRFSAIKRIGAGANQELKGPIKLGGIGSLCTESPYGIYRVELPLSNGKATIMSGVCLEKVTNTFPMYPLQGVVKTDIEKAYKLNGGSPVDLPALPKFVGGDVDFLIGAKYLRYFPEPIFSLPSGLTIYRSSFLGSDGSCGVIGGPHAIFTEINRLQSNGYLCQKTYLSEQCQLYSKGYLISPDEYYLDVKMSKDFKQESLNSLSNENTTQGEYLVTSRY